MPNPAVGKKLFGTHCASCHGVALQGSDKGPPLLHRIYEPSHHADIAFQLAVKNGVRAHHWQFGDMAPLPQVTPDDVAHVTAYVRAEQRKAGSGPLPRLHGVEALENRKRLQKCNPGVSLWTVAGLRDAHRTSPRPRSSISREQN